MPKEMYCPHHRYGFEEGHTYYKQCSGRMYIRQKKKDKTTWKGTDYWWCPHCNKPVLAKTYYELK